MARNRLSIRLLTALAFFSVGSACAQVATKPIPGEPTSSPGPAGEIVTLSPFTVTVSTDTGYQAASTLAGPLLKVPRLECILDAVKSPALKVYYGVSNMQKVGEFASGANRRLGRKRICEIHLKELDDLYGKGLMNFTGVRLALDDIGYRGRLGIEGVKTPLGVEPCIRYDLDYLHPIFPKSI